jgi:hypothetical protein
MKPSEFARQKAMREIEQERASLQKQQNIEQPTEDGTESQMEKDVLIMNQSERVLLKLVRNETLDQGDRVYLASQLAAITILANNQ